MSGRPTDIMKINLEQGTVTRAGTTRARDPETGRLVSARSGDKGGAPAGNLNRAGGVGKAIRLFERGELARSDAFAAKAAQRYYHARVKELGGVRRATVGQLSLIESNALIKGAIALILSECGARGVFVTGKGGLSLNKAMGEQLPRFLSLLQKGEAALGIEPTKVKGESLSDILAEVVDAEVVEVAKEAAEKVAEEGAE